MTKFISNVNKYLSEMKIKQTYLSMITGIDKNKMSRLLTGSQEESGTDMEKIARGLGKNRILSGRCYQHSTSGKFCNKQNCILCWRTISQAGTDCKAINGAYGKYR